MDALAAISGRVSSSGGSSGSCRRGQAAPGRDVARLQRLALARRDAGDEREVVVGAPALRADLAPSGRRRSARPARGSVAVGG